MKRLYPAVLAALFLCLSLLASSAFAEGVQENAQEERYVKIRLLAERGAVKPGEEIWVALEQSIHPGWHTYWKNPGDSGMAPKIEWSLPAGFEMGPVQWPVPRKLPYGPLLNYGYEGHAILLQKLQVPDEIPSGAFDVGADVEILVCKEECIPEYGTYSLTLNGPEGRAEDNSSYFEKARASLPDQVSWEAAFAEDGESFVLNITPQPDYWEGGYPEELAFIPEEWGVVHNPDKPVLMAKNGYIELRQRRGDRPISAVSAVNGLLTFEDADGRSRGVSFTASPAGGGVNASVKDVRGKSLSEEKEGTGNTLPAEPKSDMTLLSALFLAFFGGVVLNLMPCVFPVFSIKALSLVRIADKHPSEARLHGLLYTAGIVLSFLLIASLLIALKAAGDGIGWGFQFQNPAVVFLLAYLLFIIGMNFIGFFEIGNAFGNVGQRLTQGHGPSSSFFTGVLATLVATPCTAPFMAAAIGFALTQPPMVDLSIFAALGFGLALPYLALSFLPGLRHILPKPGAWMEIFRQALAFPMFASSVWLIWVLGQQAGHVAVLWTLMGMVGIGFIAWLAKVGGEQKRLHLVVRVLTLLLLVLLAALAVRLSMAGSTGTIPSAQQAQPVDDNAFGETYSAEKLSSLLNGDNPVFVDMTAAWCITCKVNKAIAIDVPATRTLFAAHKVAYLIGDWTNKDPEIARYLAGYGRAGVPLYVYYGPRDAVSGERPEPSVLPQILTPGIVKKAVTAQH